MNTRQTSSPTLSTTRPTLPVTGEDLPPVGAARRSLAAFAAVMTLPYLVLKIAWLSGSRVGLQDPEFGHDTGLTVLNSLTMGLDVVALVLAGIFFFRRGIRAPLWLVLPPMWIGAGLLGQILVTMPVNLVWQAVSPAQPTTGEVPPIAGWVYGMVYAGFSGLGIGLLGAFAIYAWQRWGRRPVPAPGRAARAALRTAAVLAVLTAAVQLVLADVPLINRVIDLVISGVLAAALLALTREGRRVAAIVVAFAGTGALVAWGTYLTVVLLLPNDLVGQTSVDWATVGTSLLRAAAGFVGAGALALRLRGR
ncbi:MAG: hypothetical protein GX555_16555 [Actinomycetales bacterium]|nr:hypothetical protein [Actinomycetales bacterium]